MARLGGVRYGTVGMCRGGDSMETPIRVADHFAEEIHDPVRFGENRKKVETLIEQAQKGEGPLLSNA